RPRHRRRSRPGRAPGSAARRPPAGPTAPPWPARRSGRRCCARAARRSPCCAAAPAPERSKEIDELLARNIFCPTCEPAKAAPSGPPADGAPPTLALVLVATVVGDGG